jgi:hypothetical protein
VPEGTRLNHLPEPRDITKRDQAEQAIKERLEAEKAAAEQTRSRLAESQSLPRVPSALLQRFTLEDVLDVVCSVERLSVPLARAAK